jgi:hypothetical protein
VYGPAGQPGAGEAELPAREDAVDAAAGHTPSSEYYTWNVRVFGGEHEATPTPGRSRGAPPAPPTPTPTSDPPDSAG